jgi:hypothetical protein
MLTEQTVLIAGPDGATAGVRYRRGSCVRYETVKGSVTRRAGAPSRFRFTGRLHGHALATGRYRPVARLAKTPAKTAGFRIVR